MGDERSARGVTAGSELYKPWNIIYCNFPYKEGEMPPKPHYAVLLATRVVAGCPTGIFAYTTSGAKKEDGRVPFHEIRVKDAEARQAGLPNSRSIAST